MESIELPGVAVVENNAFYNCKKLKTVIFTLIKIVREKAFENCVNLTNVHGLSKGTVINETAFENCPKFKLGIEYFSFNAKSKSVDDRCTICHQFLAIKEIVEEPSDKNWIRLNCGFKALYHKGCIKPWYYQYKTCPQCSRKPRMI